MTSRLLTFTKEIANLSKIFLPKKSGTGKYTDREIAGMFAFRLLSHAELEGLLEEWATELLQHLANRNKQKLISKEMQRRLLLHAAMVESYPPSSLSPKSRDPYKAITSLLNSHANVIESNNGVGEKDIIKLFTPLGVDMHTLDPAWLASLRTLSSARGDVAHNPWANVGVTETPTPEGERSRLAIPIFGLRALERHIDSVKSLA